MLLRVGGEQEKLGGVNLLQQPILALFHIDGGYSLAIWQETDRPSTRLPFRGSSLGIIPPGNEQDVMRKGRF